MAVTYSQEKRYNPVFLSCKTPLKTYVLRQEFSSVNISVWYIFFLEYLIFILFIAVHHCCNPNCSIFGAVLSYQDREHLESFLGETQLDLQVLLGCLWCFVTGRVFAWCQPPSSGSCISPVVVSAPCGWSTNTCHHHLKEDAVGLDPGYANSSVWSQNMISIASALCRKPTLAGIVLSTLTVSLWNHIFYLIHAKKSEGWRFKGEKGGRYQGFSCLRFSTGVWSFWDTLYTGGMLKLLRFGCWIFLWQALTDWRTTVGEPTLRQEMWVKQQQSFQFLLVDSCPLRIELGEASRNSVLLAIMFQTWWGKTWNRIVQDTQNGISAAAVTLLA